MHWRINPHDDFPFHQVAAPVDVPAQSDRHFNDGYWFAFYRGGTYVFCGLRIHPNNNVMDGYAGAVHDGVQRNVRFSRALRPRANDLAAGPFRLDVVAPLEVQRLELGPNPSGVEFSVEVTARALWPESRHQQSRHGVVLNDLLRYTGVTNVSGTVTIDGEEIAVDGWSGARDHSWGIRASMGPRTPLGGILPEDRDPRAIRIWIPFECGTDLGFFHLHEDATGAVLDFEGEIVRADGSVLELASARHAFAYEPGSRRVAAGDFTLVDVAGGGHDYRFEVSGPPVHPQGFGYTNGWSDGGNPGVWRGAEVQESNRFDVTDPLAAPGGEHLPPKRRLGGTEFAATLRGPGGTEGVAMVEHMVYGSYAPAGFVGPNVWKD